MNINPLTLSNLILTLSKIKGFDLNDSIVTLVLWVVDLKADRLSPTPDVYASL